MTKKVVYFLASFIWLLLAYVELVAGHTCFIEQKYHYETGQYLWALPFDWEVRCQCTKILAPEKTRLCGASTAAEQYWFTDKPGLLAQRTVWGTEKLKELLDCSPSADKTTNGYPYNTSSPMLLKVSATATVPYAENSVATKPLKLATASPTFLKLLAPATIPYIENSVSIAPLELATPSDAASSANTSLSSRYPVSTTSLQVPPLKATPSSTNITLCSENNVLTINLPESCNNKLGMQDGRIPDQDISASSSNSNGARNHTDSRLCTRNSFWLSDNGDTNPWVAVKLTGTSYVCGLLIQGYIYPPGTQGEFYNRFVKTILVQTSLNESSLAYIKDSNGTVMEFNTDIDGDDPETPKSIVFPLEVKANFVRLEPKSCIKNDVPSNLCALKFEILGCEAGN